MTKPVPEDKLRLGGMALRNGLLVHGPTHWAAAVRAKDGRDPGARRGASRDFGRHRPSACPGVRGVAKLAEAMAVIPLVKRALPAARCRCRTRDARRDGRGGAAAGRPVRSSRERAPSAARPLWRW